jgi:hypothetical protein
MENSDTPVDSTAPAVPAAPSAPAASGAPATPAEFTGKKIFFLFPTVAVQNKIISELVQQEFEVYIAKNKDTIRRVLRNYPGSIVFVDINEQMKEQDWETWITAVKNAPDTKNTYIGIVTPNDDEQIKRKYLLTIKVCGYTVLKFDLDKAIAHLIEVLQVLDAKGRRKFIRATTTKDSNVTLNLPYSGRFINGVIRDISVVGMSCTLEGDPDIPKNTLIKDIQVKLQTSIIKIEGIVFGTRSEGEGYEKNYVLLFTQRIDPDVRIKIRKYIQHNLQSKMDAELK